MTSDPDDTIARARLAALLTTPPARPDDPAILRNRRIWNRATEQERRRLLRDCGWL